MLLPLPKPFESLSNAPELQGGDSFSPVALYIASISAAYFQHLETSLELSIGSLEGDPSDLGAGVRKYKLKWCTALAETIARGFSCRAQMLPSSTRVVFYGEQVGVRLASTLYAYASSEVDRFAPAEYVRRYKRAVYNKQKPAYGWRKTFIREGIELADTLLDSTLKEARKRTELGRRIDQILELAQGQLEVVV